MVSLTDRAEPSQMLFMALREAYGIDELESATDLGGVNLNILVTRGAEPLVARVYRPWVTAARVSAIQLVRLEVKRREIPSTELLATSQGDPFTVVDGCVVEVERFIERDANMDTWERLESGLPWLGQVHSVLEHLDVGPEGRNALWPNHVEPDEALEWTMNGVRRVHEGAPSSEERRFADTADELARLLRDAERNVVRDLPRQLVHGDFWDNNVFFRDGRVVAIIDFDFMGVRARIDDLALTLYYTNSKFSDDPLSDERIGSLRTLVDAYDGGLDHPLTTAERAALPLALARTPLAFVGMIPLIEDPTRARKHVDSLMPDVGWAFQIVRDLAHWQDGFM